MATKLKLFNAALIELGGHTLSDTGEAVESGRILNEVYTDVIDDCLADADWNFAAVNLYPTGDTGLISPNEVGYTYGYAKPTDWVRTIVVSDDQYMVFPLTQYFDDQDIWAADTGELFIRYVSSDTGYGYDISNWPKYFRRYVELSLAERVCYRLTQDIELRKGLIALQQQAFSEAEAQNMTDAAEPRFAPTASWQSFYQQVLSEIGDPSLLTTRSGEARRALDDIYNEVLNECLASGSWNFAMETVQLDADTGVEPAFGYPEVFAKPTDWVRTIGISSDEYFTHPLLAYYDDANFLSADYTPIYFRYVSNDTGQGFDTTRWPATFRRFFELELATRVYRRLAAGSDVSDTGGRIDRYAEDRAQLLEERRDEARRKALNHDAMNEVQPKFAPQGSWNSSRGGRIGRGDRGGRNSLIG